MNDSRNFVLALVLSALVFLGWTYLSAELFPQPKAPAPAASSTPAASMPAGTVPGSTAIPGGPAVSAAPAADDASAPRVRIETPRLSGSLNLVGARLDDLLLKNYRETVARDSAPIRLLAPASSPKANLIAFGFSGDGVTTPGPETRWQASAPVLAPGRPVTLSWTNAGGQTFALIVSVDDDFMFTVESRIANRGAQAVSTRPYALITRAGRSADPDNISLHVGPVGAMEGTHFEENWQDIEDAAAPISYAGTGGWAGFSDRYWLTALVPAQDRATEASFRHSAADGRYQADVLAPALSVPPGRVASYQMRVFAGAKEVSLLDRYRDTLGIAMFDQANDWGTFGVLAKPLFKLLSSLYHALGNYGLAIIALTALVRLVLFPIASKQFNSMNKMRLVAPKMKELQERYKEDRPGMQAAMMELYKKEKINPVSGCLPIFLQIPIFFALYKCIMISIEMRHAPLALWIRDLSAPDPLTPVNLFGLLPFTPPPFLLLGILPILLGVTMYVQQKLNPPPTDPIQAKIFSYMPWIFMLFMAGFAAGLQLYWVTNNVLSIAQQWWLMRRNPAAPATTAAAR